MRGLQPKESKSNKLKWIGIAGSVPSASAARAPDSSGSASALSISEFNRPLPGLLGAQGSPHHVGVLRKVSGPNRREPNSTRHHAGARLLLIIAPIIAAIGFALFAWSGPTTPYVVAFLLPMSIVGLGMAVHVVPLTKTVIQAVPSQQTGVASGVNNAVASIADLLAIVVFSAVALSGVTSGLGDDRAISEAMAKESVARGIHLAMLLAAGLALAATSCAILTIRRTEDRRPHTSHHIR